VRLEREGEGESSTARKRWKEQRKGGRQSRVILSIVSQCLRAREGTKRFSANGHAGCREEFAL
jgi:hypothetical protein